MSVLTPEEIERENEEYGFSEINPENKRGSKLFLECRQKGNLLKVKVDHKHSNISRPENSGGSRGKVKGFSAASRKRLLEVFAGLDHNQIQQRGAAFLTLTYGQNWPHPNKAKKHLRALCKRIQRRSECENVSLVWRMEPQSSDKGEGRGAPHFHIIIFGWKKSKDGWPITADDFRNMWGDVIGLDYWNYAAYNESGNIDDVKPPRVEISFVRTARQVMSYVSKYVAKVEDSLDPLAAETNSSGNCLSQDDPALIGGEGGEASDPSGEINFINLAYLAADGEPLEYIGRSWGVMFRSNLPEAEESLVIIECNDQFEGFHRHIGWRWAKLRGETQGFTVFHEHALAWYELLQEYIATVEGVPF